MNISHSKVELYNTCAYKYYLTYVEKWSPDKTFTPLLFGSAIDNALNYLLESYQSGIQIPDVKEADRIFNRRMNAWRGQNELVYFKNEAPEVDPITKRPFEELDDEEKQEAVFHHLLEVGSKILKVYNAQVLPNFKRIISIQTKRTIPNETGDNLVLITDFTAELNDGRIVIFDNKTSSDIKKYYGPSSVKKSQQLSIYTEFEESKLAGYIALQKKLVDGAVVWNMVVDTIDEDQVQQSFIKVDQTLRAIKREEFPKNEKACYSYGRPCEYWNLCKKGNSKGLIQK